MAEATPEGTASVTGCPSSRGKKSFTKGDRRGPSQCPPRSGRDWEPGTQ